MHSIVLIAMLGLAWGLRYAWTQMSVDRWSDRWHCTMTLFLLPTLLLLTTAIALLWMGPQGQMAGVWGGWVSYCWSIGFLSFSGLCLLKQTWGAWQLLNLVRTYPIADLDGTPIRSIDLDLPYSAQIGFWQPELVISQGLLVKLDSEHRAAVIAHEQAHARYHDTFYFFWLGWLRQITRWLPQTEVIWQELLVLREIRADVWASAQTDPLLVAEALLLVIQNPPIFPENLCAAFSQMTATSRLDRRIEAILTTTAPIDRLTIWSWAWLLLALLPLLAIPFHI
jgi:Zn-dependent protease with chaperone function